MEEQQVELRIEQLEISSFGYDDFKIVRIQAKTDIAGCIELENAMKSRRPVVVAVKPPPAVLGEVKGDCICFSDEDGDEIAIAISSSGKQIYLDEMAMDRSTAADLATRLNEFANSGKFSEQL